MTSTLRPDGAAVHRGTAFIGSDGGPCRRFGLDLTQGHGAEVVIVGEGGSTTEGVRVLRRAGDCHVVGSGENIDIPTIDIISTEIRVVGNLVGSYTDLCELMALAAHGAVRLHTVTYGLDDFQSAIDDLDAGKVRGRAILVP